MRSRATLKVPNILQMLLRPCAALPVLLLGLLGALSTPGDAATSESAKRFDANSPISFTADRLEVVEETQIATFTGNVKATQSDFSLQADSIKVYYRQRKRNGQADAPAGGFGGSVARIDTSGNVRIDSQGDVAKGDWAVYDIDKSVIIVGGRVTLERGETVIKGSRMELNLETGRSRFEAVPLPGRDAQVEGAFAPSKDTETDPKADPQ